MFVVVNHSLDRGLHGVVHRIYGEVEFEIDQVVIHYAYRQAALARIQVVVFLEALDDGGRGEVVQFVVDSLSGQYIEDIGIKCSIILWIVPQNYGAGMRCETLILCPQPFSCLN